MCIFMNISDCSSDCTEADSQQLASLSILKCSSEIVTSIAYHLMRFEHGWQVLHGIGAHIVSHFECELPGGWARRWKRYVKQEDWAWVEWFDGDPHADLAIFADTVGRQTKDWGKGEASQKLSLIGHAPSGIVEVQQYLACELALVAVRRLEGEPQNAAVESHLAMYIAGKPATVECFLRIVQCLA